MTSFSNSPFEIIDALQDDLVTLKSCSQTCLSLLPLCRKYIFQSISFTPDYSVPLIERRGFPRKIILFGNLLDNNPGISDYVQNLVYRIDKSDLEDAEVPRILEKLRRIQSFKLIGEAWDWNTLCPTLQNFFWASSSPP
ncbi:hypothetical protein BDQ12DRAFT_685269 [Crucibulum laeve]|uniref:F-box domain-containing protein n=1 Tax=Crucibulum laeve TaxID=68775 RepID=A0A5C3M8C3_9AGAR|nr:hypothetical protein BDQ12DRAFT_685269 [Crucibulum laeve]